MWPGRLFDSFGPVVQSHFSCVNQSFRFLRLRLETMRNSMELAPVKRLSPLAVGHYINNTKDSSTEKGLSFGNENKAISFVSRMVTHCQ